MPCPSRRPRRPNHRPLRRPRAAGRRSRRWRRSAWCGCEFGPEFAADRQSAILAALKGAGIGTVRVEPLPFKVTTSRVGYYRSADATAAEALARLITPVVGGDAIGVRDYSQLLDGADPGRLDLWIGG